MLAPVLPEDEESRLQSLQDTNLLDTPIEGGFERITRLTKQLFDVPIVAISLVDEQRQWFKSIQGLDVCETSREVSFCGHTILQDKVFYVPDTNKDERFADSPLVTDAPHIRFYAGFPVRASNGKKLGTLCIIDSKPRQFSDEELLSLKDMAALVETEIKKHTSSYAHNTLLKELEKAQRDAMIDPLTRLWNRRGIETILKHELDICKNQMRHFALAIADIDHFKKINDEYGHNIGDEVLKSVAKSLLSQSRQNDAIARWGGEEFLILLEIEDKISAQSVLDRMHEAVEKSTLETDSGTIKPTITIGFTLYDPNSDNSLIELVEAADKALYEGKSSGRNRVVSA